MCTRTVCDPQNHRFCGTIGVWIHVPDSMDAVHVQRTHVPVHVHLQLSAVLRTVLEYRGRGTLAGSPPYKPRTLAHTVHWHLPIQTTAYKTLLASHTNPYCPPSPTLVDCVVQHSDTSAQCPTRSIAVVWDVWRGGNGGLWPRQTCGPLGSCAAADRPSAASWCPVFPGQRLCCDAVPDCGRGLGLQPDADADRRGDGM